MPEQKTHIGITSKLSLLFFKTPFGTIAFSSFIITAITGVLLALPYDVVNPYDSISLMLLTNRAAVFFRNIHYWGAQLFLIFTFLHIIDHLRRSTETEVSKGIWIRLTVSLLVTFFVMLSGFILKGDADALQAFRILDSLIQEIPFIGGTLSFTLLGRENDLQILYVNHIATATIFLWIIIVEHAKLFWTKTSTFVSTLIFLIFLSFIFSPAFHNGRDLIIKGPWYFLGFQEIFYWLSDPLWVIIFIFFLLLLFYLIPKLKSKLLSFTKISLLSISIAYLILTIIGFFFRGENWKFVMPWNNPAVTNYSLEPFENLTTVDDSLINKEIPVVLDRREGCLVCHSEVKGFSPAHNPEAIGCFSCHGGNLFSLDEDLAHKNMLLMPGDLSDAKISCSNSQCHPGIPERVDRSLMTSLSGIISVNRFVFDEAESPTGLSFITEIGHSPADKYLRNLCVSCHLGGKKDEPGPITELSRGGGCLACHLNYSDAAINQLNAYMQSKNKKKSLPNIHPSLSLIITNDHCFGCHSRSGRISTNYEGWFETELNPEEIDSADSNYRILMDDRVFQKTDEDVHHRKGMDCIDCHTSMEVMGDGNYYLHEEDQVKVQCIDCHLTSNAITVSTDKLDIESKKIEEIRKSKREGFEYLVTNDSNYPLLNTFINEKTKPFLITKNNRDSLVLNPPATICTEGKAHSRLSCNSCHTKWVSHCIGCHTEYEPNEIGYDLLVKKEVKGDWIEHASFFFAEPPALGIISNNSEKSIKTFIPGMIISIDKKNNQKTLFKRLYALTFAHTISKESHTCKSCHNNPLALGYGRGELTYGKEGKYGIWKFKPTFSFNKYDGLPEDAWIGFLREGIKPFSTREDARPFTIEEQKKILTAGACLTCHEENSKLMKRSLIDFENLLNQVTNSCLLPRWD
jgi:hypothetical protein